MVPIGEPIDGGSARETGHIVQEVFQSGPVRVHLLARRRLRVAQGPGDDLNQTPPLRYRQASDSVFNLGDVCVHRCTLQTGVGLVSGHPA